MKKNLLTLALSLITLGSLSAQSFIGKLNPFPSHSKTILADDTVKILAVMVNFQEDKDGATLVTENLDQYIPNLMVTIF